MASRSTSSSPGHGAAAYVGIERYLGRRTDVFLAVGGAVAAEAVRRGIAAPERIRVINPAIELAGRSGRPGGAGRGAQPARGAGRLQGRSGTVGRVDYQKAPEILRRCHRRAGPDDVYAIWIGDGPLRREMERARRPPGPAATASCCAGHRDDVPELLPGLDVFAMASRYEGLPCAVAEAMAAGLPVVATAVNAVPDVVMPGETGLLVSPERPRQLAAAIRLPARRARRGGPDGRGGPLADRRQVRPFFARRRPRRGLRQRPAARRARAARRRRPARLTDPGGLHGCHAYRPGCAGG